jgi:uncharacterized secreted protein with C-terminal beta-propeller domain
MKLWFVIAILAMLLITNTGGLYLKESGSSEQDRLKTFSSYEELENFVKTSLENLADYDYGGRYYYPVLGGMRTTKFLAEANATASVDHSTTNIQVEGVDEADLVKNDGKYIYVISGNKIIIIDAYPAENARILSEIEVDGNPVEIFINEDKLVIFGREFSEISPVEGVHYYNVIISRKTFIKIYDISDRENPVLKRDISLDGAYFDSRMIGDYVYVIANAWINYSLEDGIELPEISSNGKVRVIPASEIYYFDDTLDYSYMFTIIMSINMQDDNEEPSDKVFLMGRTQNLFVSLNNIYMTRTNHYWNGWLGGTNDEKTIIHKVSITDGEIEYESQGEVPGRVLNQFSMDEHQGYFRIATTTGWWDEAQNHVYVLDQDLNIVGRLENLALTERIYSARFLGGRAYLVTFRRIDPLFVLDLSDPHDPKVLGELKIPGYSDYLHPYDETHIIGVGKETGVKIALFDVSDPENPREISKYEVGGWGTDSYALRDHKAFLFSKSKNLLVIPISEGYVWQGAYVFDLSLDNGFVLKGRITHLENDEAMWGYYVKRSLYIDNVLYTVSDGSIKMHDLGDLSEINTVRLPVEYPEPLEIYRIAVGIN